MICPFSSLPGILRGKLRVVTDLQEASSANWCKELLTSVRKIAPASSMSYGSFPLPNCAWPRTEGGFEARYAYCVNNAEVSLRTGAIRADRRFLAESAGDHLDAACQAASWRLCGFFASQRSPLREHLLYTVLPTAP